MLFVLCQALNADTRLLYVMKSFWTIECVIVEMAYVFL